jgi:hypothetical protein
LVAGHEIFGEGFARFKARGGLARTRHDEPATLELVYQAGSERRFAADDRQVNPLLFGKLGQPGNVYCAEGHALGHLSYTGVTGSAVKLERGPFATTTPQGPRQRVFASARAYDEDFHVPEFSLFITRY